MRYEVWRKASIEMLIIVIKGVRYIGAKKTTYARLRSDGWTRVWNDEPARPNESQVSDGQTE